MKAMVKTFNVQTTANETFWGGEVENVYIPPNYDTEQEVINRANVIQSKLKNNTYLGFKLITQKEIIWMQRN